MKVVFLDRDGVINRERGGHTYRAEDFEIIEGLGASLNALNKRGFQFIVVTNQSGIAKGLYKSSDVMRLNNVVLDYLKNYKIELLDIFYCPHFPEKGKCLCRKPKSLMFEKAIAKYDVDVENSFCIGDSERDILAAEKTGISGILVEPNTPLLEILDRIK